MSVLLRIVRLPHAEGLPLPEYATEGSAGMDLRAAIDRPFVLGSGARATIPNGFCAAIPMGHCVLIFARSGLARKHGVALANGVAVIDEDYRGEFMTLLENRGDEPFTINRGDRIAQAVITPFGRVVWHEVAELDETARGTGGFGSTGT